MPSSWRFLPAGIWERFVEPKTPKGRLSRPFGVKSWVLCEVDPKYHA